MKPPTVLNTCRGFSLWSGFAIVLVVVVLSTDHVKYFQLRSIGYGAVCNPCMSFLPVCIRTLFGFTCPLVGFRGWYPPGVSVRSNDLSYPVVLACSWLKNPLNKFLLRGFSSAVMKLFYSAVESPVATAPALAYAPWLLCLMCRVRVCLPV